MQLASVWFVFLQHGQGGNDPADIVNATEVVVASLFQIVGHGLYEIASSEGVHGVGNARFVGDNLLSAKGL